MNPNIDLNKRDLSKNEHTVLAMAILDFERISPQEAYLG